MPLSLTSSALLSYEVLADASRLFDTANEATPAELHALNSLIEAAALHEKLYVYEWPAQAFDLGPLADLFKWGLIENGSKVDECEAELNAMGLGDVAGDVLEDRTLGGLRSRTSPSGLSSSCRCWLTTSGSSASSRWRDCSTMTRKRPSMWLHA